MQQSLCFTVYHGDAPVEVSVNTLLFLCIFNDHHHDDSKDDAMSDAVLCRP